MVPETDGVARFKVRGKLYAPEEISALILRKLAEDAAKSLGERVTEAVITVPAYFNDAQRQATQDAGKDRRPGGAADHQRADRRRPRLRHGQEGHETVLVFDLGGGTFDVSMLDVGDGVVEVRATAGDTHLGGDDFDRRIVDYLADEFKKDNGSICATTRRPCSGCTRRQRRPRSSCPRSPRPQSTCPSSPPTRAGPST